MIIIPDVHGRAFWRDALKGREDEDIIFLGDYVDPYPHFENVFYEDAIIALSDIIEFKKLHPRTVLLLGNHDLSYINDSIFCSRHDYDNHDIIKNYFLKSIDLFQIAFDRKIGDRTFRFSHAGIIKEWLENNGIPYNTDCVSEDLNRLFREGKLYKALSDVSFYRMGDAETGSCVWADIAEFIDYEMRKNDNEEKDIYQIFGHTLQSSGKPLISKHFACLDCRKAFVLDNDGQLTMLD